MQVALDDKRIFKAHVLCIFALVGIYAALNAVAIASGHNYIFGLRDLFDLDGEHNVPALFSSVAILGAAALMWSTGSLYRTRGMPLGRYWQALALVLVFLAADESFSIHEELGIMLRSRYGLFGRWQHSWVFAYAILVGVVGLAFARFLLRLPRDTRNAMIGAGCVFVAGAMGLEFAVGVLEDILPRFPTGADQLEVAIEESAEMLGVALLIRAVLKHATRVQRDALPAPANPLLERLEKDLTTPSPREY